MAKALLALVLFGCVAEAQIAMGRLEGAIYSADGRPRAHEELKISGATGFSISLHTDDAGRFAVVLPYGFYNVGGAVVEVTPMATTHIDLIPNPFAIPGAPRRNPNSGHGAGPLPFSVQGRLSMTDPAAVSDPLDFTGLADHRLGLLSFQAASWTATQFRMQGMDATDSYQPGRPLMLPDAQALEFTTVRSTFALGTSSTFGSEAGVYLGRADERWHAALASDGTGAPLAGGNLPAQHDGVERSDRYNWMTRDHAEAGGPISRVADLFASGTGQWSSQTMPLAAGPAQRSRMLYGNIRGQARLGSRDRLDALYSGSRLDLSNGGLPAGMEALAGRRMSPEFALPGGFTNQDEVDHLDFVQVGWSHIFAADSTAGGIEVRYGYSTGHLDTRPASLSAPDQSRIELIGGFVSGAPPLENLAVRTRHEFAAAWQSGVVKTAGFRHRFAAGGGWETSAPRNRFTAPSGMNLITAAGAPAFAVEYNTPLDSRSRIDSASLYANDDLVAPWGVTLNFGLLADFSRGGLPAQSSPGGVSFAERSFAAHPDVIVWNSMSSRAGFAWAPPHAGGITLRAAWFRLLAPLAGRYLDFGNPNSLGGSEYRWIDRNGDGWFEPGELGPLLMRFGGPYSSIAASLQRPYADELHAGVADTFARSVVAGVRLFRRDEKHRIAAVDTGVPPAAFTPVTIIDPGPDGLRGTFDDRPLTVWQQNPATFGQDRYLLTNPAGLRMLEMGLVAELGGEWRGVRAKASFVAEKSCGPTNPGNGAIENDSGVVGALFLDPNTGINASNRDYMDRAYIGKVQALYPLPQRFGGIQVAAFGTYLDGMVFARELLVTGLAQGAFLVGATVRGSPEGGNRAQYIMNWNLELKREFPFAFGTLTAAVDILNLLNSGNSAQEVDWSGATFNLRLPVAVQPPRYARLGVRWDF